MKTAFLYSSRVDEFDYGASHPLRVHRLALTYDLAKAYGLLDLPDTCVVEILPADRRTVEAVHTSKYLDALLAMNDGRDSADAWRYGIGALDNPVFPGLYDLALLAAGGSVQAAQLVAAGEVDVAFNIAGGLHHAMPSRASGFCYVNDPAVAIQWLVEGGARVLYVDVDAHHGDGVQHLFYDTDQVLTLSIHESGWYLFPRTGFETEFGEGRGKGYSWNVPLPPGAGDAAFLQAFEGTVPAALEAFKPDFVVSQLGVDALTGDPLTHLQVSLPGFCKVVARLRELCPTKWVALGGGGYDLANVARGWTLAWAIMNGVELPDGIPVARLNERTRAVLSGMTLRGKASSVGRNAAAVDVERSLQFLRREVLPLVRLRG